MTTKSITYDKYLEQVSPELWRRLLRAKPYQEYQILDQIDAEYERCRVAGIRRAVKVSDRRTSKSRPKKTDLRLRLDPSGGFSVSVIPLKREKGLEALPPVSFAAVGDAKRAGGSPQIEEKIEPPMGLSVSLSETEDSVETTPTRRPRGTHGLTSYAKRLLVGASNYLDMTYGKNLCFHTATLPTDQIELKRLTLQKSREILKYWRKVLSRYLSAKGLNPNHIIICLEMQKRGALHLHTVFPTKKIGGRWITPYEELDRKWRQCLTAICPELADSDFSKSCRTERLRRSAGRYLAKYLSKSISKSDYCEDLEGLSITWYSIGKELKDWCRDNTRVATVTVENLDFEILRDQLISAKVAWNLSLFALPKLGYRSLFGYCDWRYGLDRILEFLTPI